MAISVLFGRRAGSRAVLGLKPRAQTAVSVVVYPYHDGAPTTGEHMKGKVTYQDFEGGFWGITGDDGRQYLPVEGLPAEAQREGASVRFDPVPAGGVSAMMWGRPVKLKSVEVIESPSTAQ